MKNELIAPEMTMTTGQLRIPQNEAIRRHFAQYSSCPGGDNILRIASNDNEIWQSRRLAESERNKVENLKAEQVKIQLEALELRHTRIGNDRMIRKDLNNLGIPDAIADNWVARHELLRLRDLEERAKQHNVNISMRSIEDSELNELMVEMNAMLKVVTIPPAIEDILRR
jgi:hypothetical protein